MSRTTRFIALLLALAPALGACSQNFDEDDEESEGSDLSDRLSGILVIPEEVLLPVGSSVQLKAVGLLDDRSTADLTTSASWAIGDEAVAQVSNDLDSEGLLEGLDVGSTTLRCAFEGTGSQDVFVEVIDASLERLSVSPTSVIITEGDEVQLRAYASFSDGSEGEVSSQVRWITDDGGIAQIDSTGMLSAQDAGETTVHAAWDDLESEDVIVVIEEQAAAGTGGGSGDDGGGDTPELSIQAAEGSIDGGYLDLNVTIVNDGGSSATGFWVDVFVDPSDTPETNDIGDAYEYVDYLEAEGSETLTFQIALDDSSAEVWILVDTNDEIEEDDESDNSFSASVSGSGGGSTGGPDLVPTYFYAYAYDGTIYYYVDVTNDGDEDVEDLFYVDVFVDESSEPTVPSDGDSYASVSSLAAGETEWLDFTIEETCYWCYSYVLVDSYDMIDESDESNNTDGPLDVYE